MAAVAEGWGFWGRGVAVRLYGDYSTFVDLPRAPSFCLPVRAQTRTSLTLLQIPLTFLGYPSRPLCLPRPSSGFRRPGKRGAVDLVHYW